MVLVGGHVFGDSEDSRVPYCADLETGAVKWKSRGTGTGSAAVTAADGCLYVHFASGVLALVKADPAG